MLRCKTRQRWKLVSASPSFLPHLGLGCCLGEGGLRLRDAGQIVFEHLLQTASQAASTEQNRPEARPLQRTSYGPGRVLAVKLILTAGTMQACNGGHPASVIVLRQSESSALLNCEGFAAPLRASA